MRSVVHSRGIYPNCMRGTESCTNCLSWNDDFNKREKKPEAVSLMFSYSLPTVIISSALTYPIPLSLVRSCKLQRTSSSSPFVDSQREPSSQFIPREMRVPKLCAPWHASHESQSPRWSVPVPPSCLWIP
jgi:hypothetical protein